jgi:hypothetical protein
MDGAVMAAVGTAAKERVAKAAAVDTPQHPNAQPLLHKQLRRQAMFHKVHRPLNQEASPAKNAQHGLSAVTEWTKAENNSVKK